MKKSLSLFLYPFIFISCDPCKDQICGSPPLPPVRVEIVDKNSGKNLFSNGTLNPEEMTIHYLGNDVIDHVDLDTFSGREVITFNRNSSSASQSIVEIRNVQYKLLFQLKLESEKIRENCCSIILSKNIQLDSCEYDLDTTSSIYRVKI